MIDLLDGENTGLEELRAVVAKRFGIPRVDPGYQPGLDIPFFEETSVEKGTHAAGRNLASRQMAGAVS